MADFPSTGLFLPISMRLSNYWSSKKDLIPMLRFVLINLPCFQCEKSRLTTVLSH